MLSGAANIFLFNWISSTVYYKRGETNVRTEFSAEVLRERRLNVFFLFFSFFNSFILSCELLLSFLPPFIRRRKGTHPRNMLTLSLSFLHSLFLSFSLSLSFTYTTHIYTHTLSLALLSSLTPMHFLIFSLPFNLIFQRNKFGRLPLIN